MNLKYGNKFQAESTTSEAKKKLDAAQELADVDFSLCVRILKKLPKTRGSFCAAGIFFENKNRSKLPLLGSFLENFDQRHFLALLRPPTRKLLLVKLLFPQSILIKIDMLTY